MDNYVYKMRLTDSQIIAMKKLIKNGKSLNYISKELDVGKTTVYYYFREIKGKTFKSTVIKFDSDKELGEVVGIFTGDGSQSFDPMGYHYQNKVHFGLHNKDYVFYVKNLYEKCFGKKFFVSKDGPTKLVVITNSKDIFNFFHKYVKFDSKDKSNTASLKIKYRKNKNFMLGFLKGFMDTDGSLYIDKRGMRLAYYTSSHDLAMQIKRSLQTFGIKSSLTISKKNNRQIYVLKKHNEELLTLIKPFRARGLNWNDACMA